MGCNREVMSALPGVMAHPESFFLHKGREGREGCEGRQQSHCNAPLLVRLIFMVFFFATFVAFV
jgi:hypothetical protein